MRKSQGFTLIELLIVVAIIAVIAAVAIPNLLQAHMRANEANAAALLKKYAEAQQKFKSQKAGAWIGNSSKGGVDGYADNYALLQTGQPVVTGSDGRIAPAADKTLDLLDNTFAAARGLGGVPSHGYLFLEPESAGADDAEATVDPQTGRAVAPADNFWAGRFALLAVPTAAGRAGTKALYIDDGGVLMMKDLPSGAGADQTFRIETPLRNAPGWVTR